MWTNAMDIIWGIQTSEVQKSFGVQQSEFIGISSILIVLQILALYIQIIFLGKKHILPCFGQFYHLSLEKKAWTQLCCLAPIVLMNNYSD